MQNNPTYKGLQGNGEASKRFASWAIFCLFLFSKIEIFKKKHQDYHQGVKLFDPDQDGHSKLFDPDQDGHSVSPDLSPNCFQKAAKTSCYTSGHDK